MGAPKDILDLINRFREQYDSYRSPSYNEAQLRQEFVNPFFMALGWDVDNEQGHAEAYKEVIHEDSIKIGGPTKAPDYSFRIGGVRKFFVETKKPAVNIREDVSPAFQLRRYAWSAKLPLSILTDFEEFAVYDCRVRPDKDDEASKARTLYLNYEQYEEHWDELASIFSREAIRKGSFDKYAESTKKKRGTAEVDDVFLKEIEEWRGELARNLALRNRKLSQREINFAVRKTIDRIIFLRICEDRGIERYGGLQSLLGGPRIYPRLCELFRKADDRYNSGLFHFTKEKERNEEPDEWTLSLAIDDRVLKEIIRRLYYPESPYEFSVLGADILGQVYEQFLGKVIRLTKGHQAKVEDKPEVKKAGGVYYTPTYIVDYIVQQTVGKLLEGKTPHEVAARTKTTWKRSKLGRPLTVLDPAGGSGSFLIGAYRYLLDWYRDRYIADDPARHKDRVYQTRADQWRLTTAERKRILLDHIFGVDIDPQAVEVTKLSLLLKVLEGENEESLERQLRLFRERALPDLAENIKCGNSLIGPDFYQDKQLDLFDEEERLRINVFDWQAEFSEIMQSGGFDAVIGNPPYRRELDHKHLMDEIASTTFGKKFRAPRMDLWYYFVHRALELLKPAAPLSFIVNAYWTAGTGAEKLIRAMTEESHVEEIFSFSKLKVFGRVSGQHLVLRLTKGRSDADTTIKHVDPNGETTAEPFVLGTARVNTFKKTCGQLFLGGKVDLQVPADDLLAKLELHDRLDQLGKIRQGIAENPASINRKTNKLFGSRWEVGEGVFTLSDKEVEQLGLPRHERQLLRPYHDLGDLGRYFLAPKPSLTLIYSTKRTCPDIRDFPVLKNHLERFKPIMDARRETRKQSNYWWHLHWPRDEHLWRAAKIISIQMGSRPSFVSALRPAYVSFSTNVFVPDSQIEENLDYITGILNSRLLWKWYQHSSKRRGAGLEINGNVLSRSPIRRIDFAKPDEVKTHNHVAELAQQIPHLNIRCQLAKTTHERTALQRRIEAADREIDRSVYELYGLTDEEIRIVEEATAR